MIYEMAKNKKICKVDVFNIVSAHSMFTWQVEGNSVVRADRFKYESDLSREVILDILHETTKEERSIFVNELFDHLAMENINTLSEFADRGIGIIYSTLKKLMDENNESRIFAGKMMKILSRNISSDLQQTISAGRDIVMEKVSDLSSSAGKKIRNMLPGKKNEKSSEEDKEITGESSDTRK